MQAVIPHRIYVVEDHPAMRDAYAFLLDREADLEQTGTATSAEEALAAFDGSTFGGVPFDLVVVDVSLPGMDGIELVRRLRERRPDLVAVVVSAYEEDVYRRRAREAGAHAFLKKQGLERTLVAAIRAALREDGGADASEGR